MKVNRLLIIIVLAILMINATQPKKVVTVFMIGDSTMANKDTTNNKQERGWGMMLQSYFDSGIKVENHAVNGRSSKSFINEGRWQTVLNRIQQGDYVIIQFGHNDEKPQEDRHTDPGTTFDANLEKFVNETRQRGGIPILCNSVVRRIFSQSQTAIIDDDLRTNSSSHLNEGDTLVDTHGAYLLSPQKVATKMNVPFIDANRITHDLEQSLGPIVSRKLHMWFLPGETPSLPNGRQDNTHYNILGASIVAALLAENIAQEVPQLKSHLEMKEIKKIKNDVKKLKKKRPLSCRANTN